jgi:tRNA threonylcarbamoyladenosine biosynthesis protein TsaE
VNAQFTYFISDIDAIAHQILNHCAHSRILLLHGEMGAGKTTLVQAFCRALGTYEAAKSPTFGLIHEYNSATGPVYHFDLYRLSGEVEAEGLGLEEFWASGAYCFVEWPEIAPGLMPANSAQVNIKVLDTQSREISVYCSEPHLL